MTPTIKPLTLTPTYQEYQGSAITSKETILVAYLSFIVEIVHVNLFAR